MNGGEGDRIILAEPTMAHKAEALAFLQEHYDAGETHVHGSNCIEKFTAYEEWLNDEDGSLMERYLVEL